MLPQTFLEALADLPEALPLAARGFGLKPTGTLR